MITYSLDNKAPISGLNDQTGLPMSRRNLTEIRLMLTTKCNLNCTYCYMMRMCEKVESMTIETVDKVMKFIDAEVAEGVKIDFFGGEPLMQFDLIKHVIESYPIFNYGLSTNCLLLDEEKLSFFKAHKDFAMVQLSLDGTPDTQLKNRGALPNYDLVKIALKEISATVRMVAENPWKLEENVSFLVKELGAKVIKVGIPIFYTNANGYKEEFMRQMDTIKKEFPLIDIEGDKMTCEKTCYAVDNHIAVSPDGGIYPCDIFYFKGMFRFGDVVTGIDKDKVLAFQEEAKAGFDPGVPCLAHKMFMNDKWIN